MKVLTIEDKKLEKQLKRYILDLEDDLEDLRAVVDNLYDDSPTISWEEVQKMNGLI